MFQNDLFYVTGPWPTNRVFEESFVSSLCVQLSVCKVCEFLITQRRQTSMQASEVLWGHLHSQLHLSSSPHNPVERERGPTLETATK